MRRIFYDNASTTPVDSRVLDAMLPYFSEHFGNPSSHLHYFGQEPGKALDLARERVAKLINANPLEIIFTAGGTEANNMAVRGIPLANQKKGKHIIISSIEHFSVIFSANSLKKQGYEVTTIPVDHYGHIDLAQLKKAIRPDTVLMSIMHGNNEIGAVQDIVSIAKLAKETGVFFHTDAVATVGSMPFDVKKIGADAVSINAHQFYGPKGAGALFLKKGVSCEPLIYGGSQELGARSGTENVPAIVGMGKAAELAGAEMEENIRRLVPMRDKLLNGLKNSITYFNITGDPKNRLPGHVSFWIEFVEGESLLLFLDMAGISSASGSACSSNLKGEDEDDLAASHVLTAVGVPPEICHGSIAFSMGKDNTMDDVDHVLSVIPGIVDKLRAMSPLYDKKLKELAEKKKNT